MAIQNISDLNQQQADRLGISLDDYQQLLAQNPPVYQANTQGGQYGNSAGGQYMQSPGMTNALQTISLIQKYGGGGSNQNKPATQNVGPVSGLTQDAATNLGAAALGQLGLSGPMGAYAIYNPTPSQIPKGSKGGVSQVASPTTSNAIPEIQGGSGLSIPGIFGRAPSLSGTAPSSGPAPGTPTPITPANAAGGQPATPWATAPPAPGVSASAMPGQPPPAPGGGQSPWQDMAAHQFGLENAGKALYSHFGGDPSTATHADIMGFHNQLQAALANGTPFGQAPQGAANYTAGAQPGVAATGATPMTALGVAPPSGPIKMARGGFVPGDPNDNTDSVDAKLSPGEYVIPKIPQNQGPQGPPREIPRPMGANAPAGQSASMPGTSNQPQQSSSQKDDSGSQSNAGNQGYWSRMVQQAQAAKALNSGGASGGGYNIPSNLGGGYVGQSPGAGQSGYVYPNQAAATAAGDIGTGPGGAGPTTANTVAGAADVASGLTSALQKAADTYAKSIKDWTWQQQAFGKNTPPSYQATQFQQEQA